MSTLQFVSVTICALTALLVPTNGLSWADTKSLVVFGDSYSYVQGTAGRQNYSFIGDYMNLEFTETQLLSNRVVQNITSTAEGGPNWVELLTSCGLDPVNPTDPQSCPIQLWDFAFGGADISLEFTTQHHPYTVPFVNQTSQFKQYAAPVLSRITPPSETLVTVWIGINDIGDTAKFTNVTYLPTFYDELHDTLFKALEDNVYDLGYPSYLFMNLPPLDRTPGSAGNPARLPNKTMVDWFDQSLENHVNDFRSSHSDMSAHLFDANTFFNSVMDSPEKYGILNTTGYCAAYDQPYVFTDPAWYGCLPQSEYFWFNTGHLTSRTHEVLAAEVRTFLESQQ